METGCLYKVSDIKLGLMTMVIIEKGIDDNDYIVTEVLGRLQNDIIVEYLEECVLDESVTYHKVIHRGRMFYLLENSKYGQFQFQNIHLRLVRAA